MKIFINNKIPVDLNCEDFGLFVLTDVRQDYMQLNDFLQTDVQQTYFVVLDVDGVVLLGVLDAANIYKIIHHHSDLYSLSVEQGIF